MTLAPAACSRGFLGHFLGPPSGTPVELQAMMQDIWDEVLWPFVSCLAVGVLTALLVFTLGG